MPALLNFYQIDAALVSIWDITKWSLTSNVCFSNPKLHFLFIFLRMNLLEEENIRLQQTTAQTSEHIECLTILAETNCSVSSTLKHWFKSNLHVNRVWMQFNEFCSHTVGSHCESRHRGRRPSYSTYINLFLFTVNSIIFVNLNISK